MIKSLSWNRNEQQKICFEKKLQVQKIKYFFKLIFLKIEVSVFVLIFVSNIPKYAERADLFCKKKHYSD